ncbi:MAG: 3-hydroxyacyl-CoA dehydrogenase NAD-binding domain-containing protein [Spirochaetaceae bacterium]
MSEAQRTETEAAQQPTRGADTDTPPARTAPAVTLRESGGLAELVFDDPTGRANILSTPVMQELDRIVRSLEGRRDLKALLVKSGKPGMFIAGADVHEIAGLSDPDDARTKAGHGQEILNRLEDLPFPSVALIDGACLGGGLELSLACDYRIATDNPKTKLGLPETSLGIIPGFGGTYRLPRAVGLSQALQMILTAKPVDGKKAAKIGLVDAYYPAAFAEDWTRSFIDGLGGTKRPRRRPGGKKRPLGIRLLEGPLGRRLLYRRARRDVLTKTKGNYPAQPAAVDVVRKNYGRRRAQAMRTERDRFGKLAATPEAKNLTGLYFASEKAKKHPILKTEGERRQIHAAAVLGAGVMGGKIAWLFTQADTPVVMKDIAIEALQKGYSEAHDIYSQLQMRGKYDARVVNLKMHHLSATLDYEAIGDPDIVVEAVVENLDVKKKVLAEVEKRVRADTLIVSNTSSLSITEMADALEHPERFAGMHFFNPPNRMPLVEVISGEKTANAALRDVGYLALALGKTPVFVSDRPGFLVNRLLMPYLNEAVIMAEEGHDFPKIDRLIASFGMPMGPFTLLDEIGIDVGHEVARVLRAAYGERMETGGVFEEVAGRTDLLGKKSGKGFFVYGGGGAGGAGSKRGKKSAVVNSEMREIVKKHRTRSATTLTDDEIVHRPLLAMMNEAARALEEESVGSAWELDLALIMGTGFPPFRGGLLKYGDTLGLAAVRDRLVDYSRRFGSRFEPAPLISRFAEEERGFYG